LHQSSCKPEGSRSAARFLSCIVLIKKDQKQKGKNMGIFIVQHCLSQTFNIISGTLIAKGRPQGTYRVYHSMHRAIYHSKFLIPAARNPFGSPSNGIDFDAGLLGVKADRLRLVSDCRPITTWSHKPIFMRSTAVGGKRQMHEYKVKR